MMSNKQDWLKVCNDQNVPHGDFKMAFCDRCLQSECSRSIAGQSLFEQRTANWHERLFKNPDTLPEQDPRLIQIRAKKFIDIDPSPSPEVGQSAWHDPRDLGEAQQVAPTPSGTEPSPTPEAVEQAPEPLTEPAAIVQPVAKQAPQLMNTPVAGPQMIGPAGKSNSKVATQPIDPWEVKPKPAAPADGVKVLKPGARIRFSDDSGV